MEKGFDFPPEWDACACVKDALADANEFRRMQKFQRALERMTPETAARMQNVFSQFDKKGMWFFQEYSFFLRRWGEINGKAAAEFALNRGGGDANGWSGLLRQTLGGWAANDPEGVVKWINDSRELKDWQLRSSVLGVAEGLAEHNPDQAVAFALTEAKGPDAAAVFSALTEKLTYGPGLKRAEQWLAEIPVDQPDARARVLSQLLDYHLRGGPDGAVALLSDYAAADWVKSSVVKRVASACQAEGPVKYNTWVNSLPPGNVRDTALSVSQKQDKLP